MFIDPGDMSETLNRTALIPLGLLIIINRDSWVTSVVVDFSSDVDQKSPQVERDLLISPSDLILVPQIRWLSPVPSPISVSSETPNLLTSPLVVVSPSKNDHHPLSPSVSADISRVVHSRLRNYPGTDHFFPPERFLHQIQNPSLVDILRPGASSK